MEAATPTVSCIIPTLNSASFLGATIDSVLAQTMPPHEVLVVDDQSTDGSAEVAAAYGPSVHLLAGPGTGPAGARKLGVDESTGEFICFIDADDLFDSRKQERQLERFAERPEIDVSLCVCEMFWEPGLEEEEARHRELGRERGTHIFQTMLARRSVFDVVGPIDTTRFAGDNIDWLARAAESDLVFEVLDEVLVYRRMHRRSLTHTMDSMDEYVDIVKATLDRRRGRVSG